MSVPNDLPPSSFIHSVYLPTIFQGGKVSPTVSFPIQLLQILGQAAWQRRSHLHLEPLLMQAAQWKAEDMVHKGYFGHVSPDGTTPNKYIQSFGYPLPFWYPDDKNNCESIAGGQGTPQEAVDAWLNSPAHMVHITGSDPFYQEQECVGCGYAFDENSQWKSYWVFLSSPCEGS